MELACLCVGAEVAAIGGFAGVIEITGSTEGGSEDVGTPVSAIKDGTREPLVALLA